MATILKTPALRPPLPPRVVVVNKNLSLESSRSYSLRLGHKFMSTRLSRTNSFRFAAKPWPRFVLLAQTTEADQSVQEPEIEDSPDVPNGTEDSTRSKEVIDAEETQEVDDGGRIPSSVIMTSLQTYREALASNDESKITEIEAFLKSVEDEKSEIERKLITLTEELSTEKDRILRISADFDNFRKRTERERLSLVSNAQGELVENLLPVLDNFERAKAQIKVESEGEEKINNSYQSIYKQFVEILGSLGVVPVETIGHPFDPLLHEAIMREESTAFEEGIILQEFRKGFKLGDRLLRPSMVKVSAGPGPEKNQQKVSSAEVETTGDSGEEGNTDANPA
ncbi:hypothetical protein K2173_025604 [Erythroxylum novogranatense]|uniref:GrpE protein homolog n=1 Tax=Erythroxylum novogranatense TaxID=1862640 RepID=A0AAV8TA61_9ROSI|nr:hypothetical protein K2173_025604 [Erythroxylum novogranatense]